MKKFLLFFTITLVLCGIVFSMYMDYFYIDSYPVFIESYEHGTISVGADGAQGNDSKYKVMCKKDTEIVISINPERNESGYYNLEKLTVNGEDVTNQVSMLQYTTTVTQKLTVVATFSEGKRPDTDAAVTEVKVSEPDIDKYSDNTYLGSFSAYNIEDPTVFYDSESGYYYCFGSNNVVVRSTDLTNWTNRTTYFKHPENATSNTIMSFSQFDSVSKWASEHGYGSDEAYSDKNQNRSPSAPEIVKVGSTYYLYFSVVKENSANEAAIFCVKTTNLKQAIDNKEWTDAGLVISTCGTNGGTKKVTDSEGNSTTVNISKQYDSAGAMHPSVLYVGGKLFMAYGGYYGTDDMGGEIYLVELDPKTGLLNKSSSVNSQGAEVSTLHGNKTFTAGTLIADPGRIPALDKNDGSLVSGSELLYNKEAGYYYLFVTYGVGETNYSVVVSRSDKVYGPYSDFDGNDMASYSDSSMYDKGYLLIGGYGFSNSSKGTVSYTDTGRASIGSPNIIKTDDGKWFMAAQSQIYFKVGTEITTGTAKADENSLMINSEPCLEVREILWSENGWPLASPEVYSGTDESRKFKPSELYGNWDVIIFDAQADDDDYRAVERRTSQIVSILEDAVITPNDIEKGNPINFSGSFTQSGSAYTVTIDSVTYTVYPMAVWDWELREGSIVFTGIGSDGTAIWGKKKLSTSLGLYTDTFYHVYSKCEGETADSISKRIEKMSVNPAQSQIDFYTDWMLAKLNPSKQ